MIGTKRAPHESLRDKSGATAPTSTHQQFSMIELEADDEHALIRSPALCVQFDWASDRWTHALRIKHDERWILIAGATEATPAESGPCDTPAFQQLHFDRGASAVRALLVGERGPHHYSAVFEVSRASATTRVEVDVADRCRSDLGGSSSRYDLSLGQANLSVHREHEVRWVFPEWSGETLILAGWGPAEDRAGVTVEFVGHKRTAVRLAAPLVPGRATHRWRYSWSWETPEA